LNAEHRRVFTGFFSKWRHGPDDTPAINGWTSTLSYFSIASLLNGLASRAAVPESIDKWCTLTDFVVRARLRSRQIRKLAIVARLPRLEHRPLLHIFRERRFGEEGKCIQLAALQRRLKVSHRNSLHDRELRKTTADQIPGPAGAGQEFYAARNCRVGKCDALKGKKCRWKKNDSRAGRQSDVFRCEYPGPPFWTAPILTVPNDEGALQLCAEEGDSV
jgi:hypothetical protein